MRSLNFVPTWVRPGLAEGDFAPVLFHRCRHHCVDIPTCFFLDVTVHAACSCHTGVVCSGAIQLHCVIIDLRAERTPVYPQGVVGPAIELDPRWTAGTCKRVSVELCFCKKKSFLTVWRFLLFPPLDVKILQMCLYLSSLTGRESTIFALWLLSCAADCFQVDAVVGSTGDAPHQAVGV